MEKKIGMFFDSVGSLFGGSDHIPWSDRDIVIACEREVAEADEESKPECIMRLTWALVHSRQPDDVQRGIAMLDAQLATTENPLQRREKLYLLAVGYYRSGNYSKCRQLADQCLEIAPDWRQALSIKKVVVDKIAKDGVIGIGIAASAVALLAGGIVAAMSTRGK